MPGQPTQLYSAVYHGIDTTHELTKEHCELLATHGVSWVALYTRNDGQVLDQPQPGGDWSGCHSLSQAIRRRVHGAGLAIAPLQFGAWSGGVSAEVGHQHGAGFRRAARQLGIPAPVHLWADYEGRATVRAGAAAGIAALEALAAEASRDGHQVGLYYSRPQPLSAAQLWGLRGVTAYHAAANNVPEPLPRCAAIRQRLMRAGYAEAAHPRWCSELGRDCPVPASAREPDPVCPVSGIHCLIPVGVPGHDPNTLRADCLGELPVLWGP